jgi:hypothetical protein
VVLRRPDDDVIAGAIVGTHDGRCQLSRLISNVKLHPTPNLDGDVFEERRQPFLTVDFDRHSAVRERPAHTDADGRRCCFDCIVNGDLQGDLTRRVHRDRLIEPRRSRRSIGVPSRH